jgi:hypothetical protein
LYPLYYEIRTLPGRAVECHEKGQIHRAGDMLVIEPRIGKELADVWSAALSMTIIRAACNFVRSMRRRWCGCLTVRCRLLLELLETCRTVRLTLAIFQVIIPGTCRCNRKCRER